MPDREIMGAEAKQARNASMRGRRPGIVSSAEGGT